MLCLCLLLELLNGGIMESLCLVESGLEILVVLSGFSCGREASANCTALRILDSLFPLLIPLGYSIGHFRSQTQNHLIHDLHVPLFGFPHNLLGITTS